MPPIGNRYQVQRDYVEVPVVSMQVLRKAKKLTLQAVCDHINNESEYPRKVERGTISAIENGHRRASAEMLRAIADALQIPVDVIKTQYTPRATKARASRGIAE
ncbi:helix-turn-helix domain-containing protein [Mycobacteroides abscessus]|uniref:helix-turn-helix domain-containing protein n=1 Tax=Mycobacteroides abscessus TaxID=36809 RepID=UPI000695F6C8|nr:helix-turn-helix transcriptional regulator [Mycobacteroides abscessus]